MTQQVIHAELAQGRWNQLSLMDQMANVGSEFSRAFRAKKAQKEDRFNNAVARMIELFNLTLSDKRWNYSRKREIGRTKETILDVFFPSPKAGSEANLESIASFEKYFYYFGLASQNNKIH